jgi:hypothetical protein
MVTLIDGLAGGIVATIVMTAFMMTLGDDSPPPTAAFYAQYLGDGTPDDYMREGMFLHMMYGLGAGVVFAYLGIADLFVFTPVDLTNGLLNGLAYGFVLFVGAAVFWMNIVLDMDPEPADVVQFLVFHLVYGAVLGAWVGIGILG